MKRILNLWHSLFWGSSAARLWKLASILGAGAILVSCASMRGIEPTAKMVDAQSLKLPEIAKTEKQNTAFDDQREWFPSATWWKALGDPQLDSLVDQALEDNPSLRAAADRVIKAQSVVGVTASQDLPQLNGEIDAQRMQFQKTYIYPPPYGGSQFNMGTAQLNGSWELDFFGKNSSAIAAAVGAERAAEAEEDAARILLATNVVRTYLDWARIEDLRLVAQRTLEQRQQMLQLVHDRLMAGLDTQMEVRQNESGRADTHVQMTALLREADASRHALAALLGQPSLPEGIKAPHLSNFHALSLPTELSADWLARRADIVASRWRVEAAKGQVEEAKAQFYPNINLVGALGLQSLGLGRWLNAGSLEWSAGPAVRLPIFGGGRLRANLRGQTADLDAAIEQYNATVINAMRDAADQAEAVRSLALQREQQSAALVAAEGAYSIAHDRYKAGLGSYLNVLFAESAVLTQRRQVVELEAQALSSQAGLAQAMGGGWQPTPQLAPPGSSLAKNEAQKSVAPEAAHRTATPN